MTIEERVRETRRRLAPALSVLGVALWSVAPAGPVPTASEAIRLTVRASAARQAAQPAAADASSACPEFDDAVLRQLLPDRPITKSRYTAERCHAEAGTATVQFLTMQVKDTDEVDMYLESSLGACKVEPLPALGPYGRVSYACTLGNPEASVVFYKGGVVHRFNLLLGPEPSPAQRALLIELARRHHAR